MKDKQHMMELRIYLEEHKDEVTHAIVETIIEALTSHKTILLDRRNNQLWISKALTTLYDCSDTTIIPNITHVRYERKGMYSMHYKKHFMGIITGVEDVKEKW